jgi:hypothetical protein
MGGAVVYYKNTGSSTAPVFETATNPLLAVAMTTDATPFFFDIDLGE